MNKRQLDAQLTIHLPKHRKQELEKIAKDQNISVGTVARAAIGNFIAYRKRFKGDRKKKL